MRSAAAAALVSLLALQGCKSLPDAEAEIAAARPEEVKFESARGPVSEARSQAIIEFLGKDGDTALLERHLGYEQKVNSGSPLVLGNKVSLLKDGPATYEAMFAAIREARDHINLETYIFGADGPGTRFRDLLIERQAAGVQVNVIHDSIGTLTTPKEFFDRLREAGVNVLEFNPVNPLKAGRKALKINNRDHRRQLVIDGRIAFTGGVNISSTYSSAPSVGRRMPAKQTEEHPLEDGWRDTHVRIEGPVVEEFQKMFLETWRRQKGAPLAARNYLPVLKPEGNHIVRAIGSTPDGQESLIYLTLLSAITHAESKIHIANAYFAPDKQMRKALTDAARRGVDVRLVLPSYSDAAPVFHLGRSYYTEMLESGVKIHELKGAFMHAKTACIDGVWSTVGSSNLDWRSFLHNDEINAVVLGRGFAAEMEVMFDADLRTSQAIELAQWRKRPWLQRIKEYSARLGAYWL